MSTLTSSPWLYTLSMRVVAEAPALDCLFPRSQLIIASHKFQPTFFLLKQSFLSYLIHLINIIFTTEKINFCIKILIRVKILINIMKLLMDKRFFFFNNTSRSIKFHTTANNGIHKKNKKKNTNDSLKALIE